MDGVGKMLGWNTIHLGGGSMPTETNAIEHQTVVVSAAYLVKGILRRLDFVSAIDYAPQHQPELGTT
jgi:hypothetical protein